MSPILQGVYKAMTEASIADPDYSKPLEALTDLLEIRIGSNVWPVCSALVSQVQFQPELNTKAVGREVSWDEIDLKYYITHKTAGHKHFNQENLVVIK